MVHYESCFTTKLLRVFYIKCSWLMIRRYCGGGKFLLYVESDRSLWVVWLNNEVRDKNCWSINYIFYWKFNHITCLRIRIGMSSVDRSYLHGYTHHVIKYDICGLLISVLASKQLMWNNFQLEFLLNKCLHTTNLPIANIYSVIINMGYSINIIVYTMHKNI